MRAFLAIILAVCTLNGAIYIQGANVLLMGNSCLDGAIVGEALRTRSEGKHMVNLNTSNRFAWADFLDLPQDLEHVSGRTFYDTGALTLATMSGITGVVNQIGQEDHELVYNQTGSQIDNGQAVYRNGVANVEFPDGVTRAVPTIALAQADSLTTSVSVAGLATADIANTSLGLVTQRGLVRDFDTTGLGFVGPIYLSPTTPGGLTSTQPSPPNRRVLMGGLLEQDADTGVVLINISFQLEPHLISKDYSFTSRGITAGTFYRGGFYDAPAADGNLSEGGATLTFGDANRANSGHAFIVAGAAGTVASGQVGIRVNGISITDLGVRNASDSEELTDDITSLSTDEYIETDKKWLGQPTWELFVVSGTPPTYSLDFNYGFAKYEDIGNRDICIADIEVVGLAGATDSDFNVELLHHKATGWTYDAAAFIPGNGAIAAWSTDMTPDDNLVNGKPFAWKHVDIFETIQGATAEEGIILRITAGQNNSVQSMDMHLGTLVNVQ